MLDNNTLQYFYSLRRRGIKIGLHRTEALLSKCGNPHKNIPVIHIAGTNGKGSTATIIASVLRESGKKVGLYTSPHLISFNERIRVNGAPIQDEHILNFLDKYRDDIDTLGSTFFETTTALTFSYFSQNSIDIAVIEVGLGGRLDSTNVSNSVLSVITPIDYDHTEFLGHTLESIAKEKCGILKTNVPVVVASQQSQIENLIKSISYKKRSPFNYVPDKTPAKNIITTSDKSSFTVKENEYSLPLLGKHQVINAQTAITACKIYDPPIDDITIKRGLINVKWPGRLQLLSETPRVYYDVAHNPHGLSAVLSTLNSIFKNSEIFCICALKRSKELDPIISLLKKYCTGVITTTPDHEGFYDSVDLYNQFQKSGIKTEATRDITTALNKISANKVKKVIWLIFGTHYIAETVFKKFHFLFDKAKI